MTVPSPPSAEISPVTWRVRHFLIVFLGTVVGASLIGGAAAVLYRSRVGDLDGRFSFLVSAPIQIALAALLLWLVARSLSARFDRDLGFVITGRDVPAVFLGSWLLFVVALITAPLIEFTGLDEAPQALVNQLLELDGGTLLVAVLGSVVAAPIVEELQFRGILQRALAARFGRRTTMTLVAAAFGLAHALGIDPSADLWLVRAGITVVSVFLLGLVLSWLADRDGRLGRAILTHAGFNATTLVITVVLSGSA